MPSNSLESGAKSRFKLHLAVGSKCCFCYTSLPLPLLSPLNIETILLQISSLWRSRLSIVQSYSKYDLTFANYLFTLYILIHIYSYIRFFEYTYILYYKSVIRRGETLLWTINANFATDWSLLFFLASWSQKTR